ncbi:NADP-dependent phosphogluconate dehydrogenase [Candidatus Peregrinibacteria bacterium]|nr:NADP-dependent phosphogluconate dehydrogenase [Candidatus Peregrinibacteria bacterium]
MGKVVGLIGLATMGKNLARNIAGKGFSIIVYNRTAKRTEEFIKEFGEKKLSSAKNLKEFVKNLEQPRKIILLVKAGEAVDETIEKLMPLLSKGDIISDLGNSRYSDTFNRFWKLKKKGLHFIGCGISGGEEGALHGPSLMPGGDKNAYRKMRNIFRKIAADDGDGGKCVSYIGPVASGHFIKMVHNGIEYALMQAIAESYDILKKIGKSNNKDLSLTFANWNKSETLNSFLIGITANIFARKDNLIDFIKDIAGQKGTGRWTSMAALEYGIPIPTIHAAVDARALSGDSIRKRKKNLPKNFNKISIPKDIDKVIKNSLECSFVCILNQGLTLIRRAGKINSWNLDMSEIIRIWRGGCIIRAKQLEKWQRAYGKKPQAQKATKEIIKIFEGKSQQNWRSTIALASQYGIPVPTMGASLSYYDTIIAPRLPQNLIQAQRDLFGAHSYERTDKKGVFHTEWYYE